MKHLLAASVCAVALAGGAHASTVTANIDFVALVADIGEGGYEGSTFNFDGLDVTLTSSADAYLDGLSRGLPAGLGVCSAGLDGDNECADPGDDNINIMTGEFVTLTFGPSVVSVGGFTFRDNAHMDITGSAGLVNWSLIDDLGQLGGQSSFGNIESEIALDQIGEIQSITFLSGDVGYYLSGLTAEFTPAPVPLPASVLLLGGALAGVGALKRRRKA